MYLRVIKKIPLHKPEYCCLTQGISLVVIMCSNNFCFSYASFSQQLFNCHPIFLLLTRINLRWKHKRSVDHIMIIVALEKYSWPLVYLPVKLFKMLMNLVFSFPPLSFSSENFRKMRVTFSWFLFVFHNTYLEVWTFYLCNVENKFIKNSRYCPSLIVQL